MIFEFGKYTEVTDFAKETNSEYNEYERVFMCPDVHDVWIIRILKGYDEDYDEDAESYILERNKYSFPRSLNPLSTNMAKYYLEEDDFSNWDMKQSYDLDELIDMVDGGFGILNLKEKD